MGIASTRHHFLRRGALVLALALLPCAAPALASGDPLSAALSTASKATLKELKASIGATLKTAGDELKAGAAGYADGTLDGTQVIDQIVATITAQRDAMEDAALAATQQLAADAAALLADAAVTAPNRDFQAGGGGLWDKSLAGVDKLLDDADTKLDAALFKTVQGLLKSSAKLGSQLDVRWRFPQHGIEYRTVDPPFLGVSTLTADGGAASAPAQVLIAVRFVDTSTTDRLALGTRGGPASVELAVSSKAGEQVDLAPLVRDGSGTATGAYAIAAQIEGTGFVTLELQPDPTLGPDVRLTLSLPHTGTAAPGAVALVKDFKKSAAKELKFFNKDAAGDAKFLSKFMGEQLKDVAASQSAAPGTLKFCFDVMRNMRNLIAFVYADTTDSVVGPANAALTTSGFTDAELPVDLAPDGAGLFGKLSRSWNKTVAKNQAAVSKAYAKLVDKFAEASIKHPPAIAVNFVLGQTRLLSFPMFTTAATPPVDELVRPHITDAQVIRIQQFAGPDDVDLQLAVQSDPAVVPTVVATRVQLPDDTPVTIGSLVTDLGGAASVTQALPTDVPFIGWVFRAGQHAAKQQSLILVVTPDVIPLVNDAQ